MLSGVFATIQYLLWVYGGFRNHAIDAERVTTQAATPFRLLTKAETMKIITSITSDSSTDTGQKIVQVLENDDVPEEKHSRSS